MYWIRRERHRLQIIYDDYPRQFWILVLGTFIDRVGGALLWPFFTLYITRKFGVGMTQVGMLFGAFSIASLVGSMLGGALADHLGRSTCSLQQRSLWVCWPMSAARRNRRWSPTCCPIASALRAMASCV